ncbi:MAG TPA: hypothetical protein VGW38_06710, partial [Chloroflexota bacterium]|nr:hypothetical protein [Chloroflexota bacterium]
MHTAIFIDIERGERIRSGPPGLSTVKGIEMNALVTTVSAPILKACDVVIGRPSSVVIAFPPVCRPTVAAHEQFVKGQSMKGCRLIHIG